MTQISVENSFGVVDGLTRDERVNLERDLDTEVKIVGDRLKFKPTRDVLDELVKRFGAPAFDVGCRIAWARFYRKTEVKAPADFNFKTDPYPHQRDTWADVKDREYYAFEWDMGLGKTKVVLDVLAWKYAIGEIDAVLVVTLKGVHQNWTEIEIPTHLSCEHSTAYWNSGRVENGMRGILEGKGLAVATINFDSVHRKAGNAFCKKFMKKRKVALVVDESHNIKTPGSARTKAVHRLSDLAVCRFIMTGTLVTSTPLDVWSQYEALSPKILGGIKFHEYKKMYAVEQDIPGSSVEVWEYDKATGTSKRVERPAREIVDWKNLDDLKMRLDPHRSNLLKEDVLDLPDRIYRLRSFVMTDAMRKAYQSMLSELRAEIASGVEMTVQMAMTREMRLSQIACGFFVPDDRVETHPGIPLDKKNPRLEALMQSLEEVRGKGIIWANWRYSLDEISDALKTAYGSSSLVQYRGGMTGADKMRSISSFQDEDAKWFLGNPQSGGTGITLTAASDMFYYSTSNHYALRKQSEDRNYRIGQTKTCTITDFEALGTVDRKKLKRHREKYEIATELSGMDLLNWLVSA